MTDLQKLATAVFAADKALTAASAAYVSAADDVYNNAAYFVAGTGHAYVSTKAAYVKAAAAFAEAKAAFATEKAAAKLAAEANL